jgi:hypothetical protein
MTTSISMIRRPMGSGLTCPTMPSGTPTRARVSTEASRSERWLNLFLQNYHGLIIGRLLQRNSGSRMERPYSPASFSLQTLYRRNNGDCFSITRGYSSHRAWWQVSNTRSSKRLEAGPSASMAERSQDGQYRSACRRKCVGEEKVDCRPGNAWSAFYPIS